MSYLRQRINFQSGVVSGTITNSQTTISGIFFSTAIAAGSAVPVVLNPSYYGSTTSPEIIYVTSVSGNVATVLRAQEGTTAVAGTSLPWVAGPLASDFDVSNLTSSGTLTLSGTGGLTVSGNSTFNNVTVTGAISGNATLNNITANNITANNITATGTISTGLATISGNTINAGSFGSVNAYAISGVNGTFTNNLSVSGTIKQAGIPVVNSMSNYPLNIYIGETFSGFNNYLVLVNGYGTRSSSGYMQIFLNSNGTPIVTAQTASPGNNSYYSFSNMTIYSPGASTTWTATLTTNGFTAGDSNSSAIIIGIN